MDTIISSRGVALRRTLLVLSGLLAFQAGPACAAPLSLAASLESPTRAEGQPVMLDLALHNDGLNNLIVGSSAFEASSFKIKMSDGAGRLVPRTAFGDQVLTPPGVASSNIIIFLGPGRTLRYRYNLARMFDLSRTGEYDVTVGRTLVPRLSLRQPRAGEAEPGPVDLTAGPLRVRITTDSSLTSGPEPVTTPPSRGAFLYVSNNASPPNQPGDVVCRYKIGSSGRPVPTLDAPTLAGRDGMAVATTPDGRFLYVANGGDATVSQFRIGDNGALSALAPPDVSCTRYPLFLLMDARGRFLYALSGWGNTLYAIGRDGRLTVTRAMPSTSWPEDQHDVVPAETGVMDPTGSFLYVCNGQTFIYHLGPDGQVTAVTAVSAADHARDVAITLSPSGRFAFVGCSRTYNTAFFDEVAPLRVEADGTLSRLPGTQPSLGPNGGPSTDARALVVDPSGRFLLVLSNGAVTRYRINTVGGASLSPLGATPVFGEPIALLFGPDGHTVYALNSHTDSVSTFRLDDDGDMKQVGLETRNDGPFPGGMAMATAPTPQNWGPAASGVEMSARLTDEVLPVNAPVVLTVTLRNTSRRPVSLGTTGADMSSLRLSFPGQPAASLLSAGHDLLDAPDPSAAPLILPPGGKRQYRLVLSRLADLSLTGQYAIQVSRVLPGGGAIAAPLVRFRLQGPYEGLSGDTLERLGVIGPGARPLEIQ